MEGKKVFIASIDQVIACIQNADRLMYEDKRSRKNAPGQKE